MTVIKSYYIKKYQSIKYNGDSVKIGIELKRIKKIVYHAVSQRSKCKKNSGVIAVCSILGKS